jgi:predicted aldo/keto reductase-like oxidoreductase
MKVAKVYDGLSIQLRICMKSKKTSRRAFLSAGLILPVAGVGARMGLASTEAGLLNSPEGHIEEAHASPAGFPMRTLGRTGLKVTPLGFGGGFTADTSVVERAVDLGINYFDTARAYLQGNNERLMGIALGPKRKQIVLSTKSKASDKAAALKDLETSLRELKTDYVDIWYCHDKPSPDNVTDGMLEAHVTAKQQGKIRFSGLSTHANQQQMLPWMAKNGFFDVVMTGYNFSMDSTVAQAIDIAAKAGIGIVAMKVMAGGFRSLKPSDPIYSKFKKDGAHLAALKWAMGRPNIATTVPGMTDMDQLDENFQAMSMPFSPSDEKLLDAHLELIKPLYCRMCGQCEGACQQGLPVADVLRYLTYADGYRQFAMARENFQQLPAAHRAVRCGDCADCTVQCPHGVRVSDRMARAQELFA